MQCPTCGGEFQACKLDKEQRARLERAARLIDETFHFKGSQEGHDYWNKVYHKLINASDQGYI